MTRKSPGERRDAHAVNVGEADVELWARDVAENARRLIAELETLAFDFSSPAAAVHAYSREEIEDRARRVRGAFAGFFGLKYGHRARVAFLESIGRLVAFQDEMRPLVAASPARDAARPSSPKPAGGALRWVRGDLARDGFGELAERLTSADVQAATRAWRKADKGRIGKWSTLAAVLERAWAPKVAPIDGDGIRKEWERRRG
jgi:hypothetical protein